MPSPIVLEVVVDSVESAIAAAQGGAQRVEVCSDLVEGGITPSAGLIAMVRKRVTIGVGVLIRPRAGDFCYSPDEFKVMKRDILLARQLGGNGVVFGILDPDANVDTQRTSELVALARPLAVTFHRAFDLARDQTAALEEVVKTGADRILTSGGARTAEEGAASLAQLVKAAAGRIRIMACGRIREANVEAIVNRTGVREIHAALQTAVSSPMRLPNQRPRLGSFEASDTERFVVRAETVAALLAAAAHANSGPHPSD